MKRTWFLVLALSVGLNAGLVYMTVSSPGSAPGSNRPPPPGHFDTLLEDHLKKMTQSLGLAEKQRDAIAAIHRELLPKISEQHRAMEALRQAIATHYEGPDFDAAAFRKLARNLSEAQARLDALVTEAMLGEANLLRPDQRRKYAREMPWGRRGAPPPGQRPEGKGRDKQGGR
jgi:Spy/CpxP family protein refolding chaperone